MGKKSLIFDDSSISEDNLKKLLEFLKNTKYGSITLVVQDSVVIQLERNEKLRLR